MNSPQADIVAISGASGFLGSSYKSLLEKNGCIVKSLVRRAVKSENEIFWDPEKGILNPADLSGVGAVIHLAAESIAKWPWTKARKARLRNSRILGTSLIAKAISEMPHPPKVLLSASATGFYGNRGQEQLNESSKPGVGFLAELAQEWESATHSAELRGVRVVHLRLGVVLAQHGGMLAKLLPIFKLGLGGKLGNGKQFLSWISLEDTVRAIDFIRNNREISGAVNLVAPGALTNFQFTKALGAALNRPTPFPAPAFILKLLMGEFANEALLSSTFATPKRLNDAGFKFNHPDIALALSYALTKEV